MGVALLEAPQTRVGHSKQAQGDPLSLTLLDLVASVSDVTGDEREVVATVLHMLRSGRVRLCGNFRDAAIEELEG